MDLILVRHGQPDWTPGRRQRNDPDLTELGREQALRVARRLAETENVDEIWVSTMRRAAQTAEPIAERLDIEPRRFDWLEEIRNPPDWEGAPAEEIERFFAEANQRDMDRMWEGLPGGESFRAFHRRVVTGLNRTLEEMGVRPLSPAHRHLWNLQEPKRRVVIVAHAGTNAVVLGHLLGLDPVPWEWERFAQPHTGVSRLRLVRISTGWGFSLRQLGDASHLERDQITF
ncbi:MAG: histidine phosphatase family protein [Actinomycetes bacterium]|jgi:broad specificity phosphatase PhoE